MEETILNSLSMPVLVVDSKLRVVYANPAAGLFWRTRPGALTEYGIAQLFGGESPVLPHVTRAIDEEISTTIDACPFPQGMGLPQLNLHVQIDPLQQPHAPVERALVILWDQTQREFFENTRREGHMMDSIGLMLKRLAHELQNPLSGIKGATQLLSRKVRHAAELREYPDVILRELERMQRLVGQLLGQGEVPPLVVSRFNLHELLDTVIWFERNTTDRVAFVRAYDPSLPEIEGDRDRLHQVFLNLFRNAVEASPAGEEVLVRTGTLGPWQGPELLPDPAGTFFHVEVMDRGPGVSEENVPNLFTPFFTTKKHGNGLGLSISHQIVRAHRGVLRYHARPGGGAVFSVVLPWEFHP